MIARQIVPYLQVAHGLFNGLLFLAFARQGFTGWRNRRKRIAGAPPDFAVVRTHRRSGPILAVLLAGGYGAGVVTVLVDHGTLARHPAHLAIGTLLVLLVAVTVLTARRIRDAASPWRTRHAVAGLAALALFLGQVLLGAGILF